MADVNEAPQGKGPTRRAVLWLVCMLGVVALVAGMLYLQRGQVTHAPHTAAARTATAGAAATATASPVAPTGTVAYVSDGQVVIARPGKPPLHLTHIAQPDRDPTHWGPIAWAPDAAHLAVAVGDPIVDANQVAGATGQLYIVALRTGAITLVTPHAAAGQGVAIGPETYAWENATQLLFAVGGTVFTYDVATGTVAPLAGLSRTTVLDLAVRREALYYASYTPADGPLTALPVALRRFDLLSHADIQVADLGQVLLQVTGCDVTGCVAAQGVAATLPAWDVSADESALAYARVTGLSADRTRVQVSFLFASSLPRQSVATPTGAAQSPFGAPSAIFTGVTSETPAGLPNACCYLRFSPDGRALALTSGYAMPEAFGPFVLYPRVPQAAYQVGFPWAFGPAAWRPDSRAFSLTTHRGGAPSTTLLTYGDGATSVLATDAYSCAYAPLAR